MALKFNESKGSAVKTAVDGIKYKDGDNTIRIVGDILPRYVYWIKGENNKDIPMECLAFDRDLEKFTNAQKDWVKVFFPDLNCSWAYAAQCIDPEDPTKVKVVNLKKKLWEQVITVAEDLGDPTDPDTGWDIKFKRVKTGPLAFNVEYQIQALKCKNRPLSAEEKEAIKDLRSMEEVMVRPTPEAQKELLDRITGVKKENVDSASVAEFDVS